MAIQVQFNNTNKMKKTDNKDDRLLIIMSGFVVLLVVGLWVTTYLSLFWKDEESRGTFGDMFGGVNALFSGLAFGGIIISIFLQRQDIGLQRDEIRATKVELARTATSQEFQQNQTTFFHLIENNRKLIETLRFNNKFGFEGFRKLANQIRSQLNDYSKCVADQKFSCFQDTLKHPTKTLVYNNSNLKIYFYNLETITQFISENLKNQNTLFSRILYNSLSIPEKYVLGIVFYYCKFLSVSFLKVENGFNFLDLYESNYENLKNLKEVYFPSIEMTPVTRKYFDNNTINSSNSILKLTLEVSMDFPNTILSLTDCKLQIKDDSNDRQGERISIYSKLGLQSDAGVITIDLSEELRSTLKKIDEGSFFFSYELHFSYEKKNYIIYTGHRVVKVESFYNDFETGESYESTEYTIEGFL